MKRNDKFKAYLSQQLKAKPNFNLVRPNTIINHTFIKTRYEWESYVENKHSIHVFMQLCYSDESVYNVPRCLYR